MRGGDTVIVERHSRSNYTSAPLITIVTISKQFNSASVKVDRWLDYLRIILFHHAPSKLLPDSGKVRNSYCLSSPASEGFPNKLQYFPKDSASVPEENQYFSEELPKKTSVFPNNGIAFPKLVRALSLFFPSQIGR